MLKRIAVLLTAVIFVTMIPTFAEEPIRVLVNGQQLTFDQPPIIENDRTLVPVRAIFEALGAQVEWTEQTRQVTAQRGADTVMLWIGEPILYQNGTAVVLDAAPKIVNDRTLVPVRAVSESFHASVDWNESARLVTVNTVETDKDQAEEMKNFAYRVFALTNAEREAVGLTPFVWSDDLANIAQAHSKDMNDRQYMDHTNPDGQSPFDRIRQYGLRYTRAAENIAAGQRTPEEVVKSWMSSEGHRANILNPELKQLGVGFYEGDGPYRKYWTQVFLTP